MSLLMDALKKAELAKRQGGESGAEGNPEDMGFSGLALEPMAGATTAPASAETAPTTTAESVTEPPMSLASHLEELDARFLEEAAAAARIVPPPSIATTKVDALAPPAPPPRRPPNHFRVPCLRQRSKAPDALRRGPTIPR